MKKTLQLFFLSAAILTLSFSTAQAQPVSRRPPDMPPSQFADNHPMENIIEQLGFSQEQKEKLKEHKHKYDIVNIEILNKIEILRQKLQYELTKKEIDKAAIDSLVEETKQQQEMLLKNHVERIVALRELMTYEQFEKLEGLHQKARGRSPGPPHTVTESAPDFVPGH
jgi:Spy/CpxP family protein refolding chaperone